MSQIAPPQEVWGQYFSASSAEPDWLWHGLLARGEVTLLTSHPQATDYVIVPDPPEMDFQSTWPILRQVFQASGQPLTRQQIIAAWPAEYAKPARTSLWRWLDRAARGNLIGIEGTGSRNDPFRYWLPK